MQGLVIVLIIISFILVILIYLQSGKVKNIGSSIVGIKSVELFETTKRRGFDRILFWSTIFLVFLFFLFSLILFLAL